MPYVDEGVVCRSFESPPKGSMDPSSNQLKSFHYLSPLEQHDAHSSPNLNGVARSMSSSSSSTVAKELKLPRFKGISRATIPSHIPRSRAMSATSASCFFPRQTWRGTARLRYSNVHGVAGASFRRSACRASPGCNFGFNNSRSSPSPAPASLVAPASFFVLSLSLLLLLLLLCYQTLKL